MSEFKIGAQTSVEKDDSASLLPVDAPASPASTETLPSHALISGSAGDGDVEIRYELSDKNKNEVVIDEIVARDASVHLERMDKGQWALIIDAKKQRACFMLNGKDVARSVVTTQLFWIDQVGSGYPATQGQADSTRRSEAP